jgi:hypothetical protein
MLPVLAAEFTDCIEAALLNGGEEAGIPMGAPKPFELAEGELCKLDAADVDDFTSPPEKTSSSQSFHSLSEYFAVFAALLAALGCDAMLLVDVQSGRPLPGDDYRAEKIQRLVPNTSSRFENLQIPPNVPVDPQFKLMATTFICRSSPAECMNCLLDFFERETLADVTKVCKAKFAVKVDVFDRGTACSLKFRMYKQQSGELVVEFQRRSGDTIAFHHIIRQACLKSDLTGTKAPADVTPMSNQSKGSKLIAECAPLVEMLSLVDAPQLQAEAAASLANVASQDLIVDDSVSQLLKNLNDLLQIDRIDVAYPTACLLSALADCAGARTVLVDSGLVSAMEEQIQSAQKTVLVKQQLGAAVDAWHRQGR